MRPFTRTIIVTLAVISATAGVGASDTGGHGALCSATSPGQYDYLSYSGGVYNTSSAYNVSVLCSTQRPTQASPRNLYLDYSNGTANTLVCSARVLSWADSEELWVSSKSAGTGTGFFLFTLPVSMMGYIAVTCTLPKPTNSLRAGVIGFNLQ